MSTKTSLTFVLLFAEVSQYASPFSSAYACMSHTRLAGAPQIESSATLVHD